MLAFVFLVGLPIAELLLLILAGSAFGFWPTVGAVLGTALLGVYLIRQQGLAALRSAQEERVAGEVPVGAILDGIRLAFAGILLVIPGFITDGLGLLLLIPGMSSSVISAAERGGTFRFAEHRSYRQSHYGRGHPGGDIVDADYEVVSDPQAPPAKASGENEAADSADPKILPPNGKGNANDHGANDKGRRNG